MNTPPDAMKHQQRVPINFSGTRRASVEIGRLTREVCASGETYTPAMMWDEAYEEAQRKLVASGLQLGWYEASKVPNDAIETLDGFTDHICRHAVAGREVSGANH